MTDFAGPAEVWNERLDRVEERLVVLAALRTEGLTHADPATGECWDSGQVWAHLAEFVDYWWTELEYVLAAAEDVPAFGRVKTDPARISAIEAGRREPTEVQLAVVRSAIARLRARLSTLTPDEWTRVGEHQTLGLLDVSAQLEHFHVGHLEEHAAQLEELVSR